MRQGWIVGWQRQEGRYWCAPQEWAFQGWASLSQNHLLSLGGGAKRWTWEEAGGACDKTFPIFLGLYSPGQEPLLAGDQRHPDLGRLLSETRVDGAAEQCAVQRSGVMAARCSVFTLPRREGRELTTGERKRNSSQQQQKRRRRSKGAGGREKGGGYRHFHHLMMTVMVVHLGDATRK